MTKGLKFLLYLNGKLFDFKKTSFQILWIFICNKCTFVRLWSKISTFGLANLNRYNTGKTAVI